MKDFGTVYQTYYEDVYRFLRGMTGNENLAEELTQETFCRALRSIDTFKGNSDMRVWLCAIGKNLYFTYCKQQKRLVSLEDPEQIEDESKHFTEMIADKALAIQLHKLLHALHEPYKEVFTLRIFGELSFREIGEIFGKSEHWACVTFHRAKAMMQDKVKEERL